MLKNPVQKRVLTIEDISCFGKCSTTVALPILSAMGHETVILPTAILSTHTGSGFTGYTVRDLTDDISPISDHWYKTGIVYDCLYSGYLCKGKQVSLVRDLVKRFKSENTLYVADPAMADGGKYYWGFDAEHGADMGELCRMADIITPNVTEAAFLLGQEYQSSYSLSDIHALIDGLREQGIPSVVLTSVTVGDKYGIVGYDGARGESFSYFHRRIDAPIHGTGDIYTSVMVGRLLSGWTLAEAARCAADFVMHCVEKTLPYLAEHPYGLIYEPYLRELMD